MEHIQDIYKEKPELIENLLKNHVSKINLKVDGKPFQVLYNEETDELEFHGRSGNETTVGPLITDIDRYFSKFVNDAIRHIEARADLFKKYKFMTIEIIDNELLLTSIITKSGEFVNSPKEIRKIADELETEVMPTLWEGQLSDAQIKILVEIIKSGEVPTKAEFIKVVKALFDKDPNFPKKLIMANTEFIEGIVFFFDVKGKIVEYKLVDPAFRAQSAGYKASSKEEKDKNKETYNKLYEFYLDWVEKNGEKLADNRIHSIELNFIKMMKDPKIYNKIMNLAAGIRINNIARYGVQLDRTTPEMAKEIRKNGDVYKTLYEIFFNMFKKPKKRNYTINKEFQMKVNDAITLFEGIEGYEHYANDLIKEDKHNKELIKTAEECKEYLKRKLPRKEITLQDDLKIYDDEIDALYEYVKENNLPAPIVGYYNGEYNIAFRRYFNEDIQKKIDIDGEPFSFNHNSQYFKGYHNTALKEDGKFVPTAQDYEELICFAYNKKYCKMNDDDNANAIGINNNKKQNLINFFNINEQTLTEIADVLHEKCGCDLGYGKLKNESGNKIKSDWSAIYENGKPNATPKTDIISLDKKYRISLKESGGSQLMSAKLNEAKATLLFATEYVKNETDKNKILVLLCDLLNINESDKKRKENTEDVFDEFSKDDLNGKTLTQMMNDDSDFRKRVEASKQKGKTFESQLNKLILDVYPQYKEGFFKEAMTGYHKFTEESCCAANCVLVWDDVNTSNSNVYSIDEYYKHIENKSKVVVDFKSWPTSNRSGQTLKIITK